ncbi:addiction module protein [Calditrichota bacterium]
MTLKFKQLKKRAIALSLEERSELAHDLINSLDDSSDSSHENEWDNEIKRRVEEIKSGKAKGRPALDVLADIRAKYL